MARKKGKAKTAPKAILTTPDKNKQEKITAIDFHLECIERETKKKVEELTRISEEMIAAIEQENDEFVNSVPPELLNMKLCDLFEAGYKLDYSACHTNDTKGKPYLSIAPFDFEPEAEPEEKSMKPPPKRNTRTTRAPSSAQATRSTRSTRLTSTAHTDLPFGTPAAANSTRFSVAITPKLVPAPMRGYKVFYSENGSPIMVNQTTMTAKAPR